MSTLSYLTDHNFKRTDYFQPRFTFPQTEFGSLCSSDYANTLTTYNNRIVCDFSLANQQVQDSFRQVFPANSTFLAQTLPSGTDFDQRKFLRITSYRFFGKYNFEPVFKQMVVNRAVAESNLGLELL